MRLLPFSNDLQIDWYEILDVMLLLGHILEVDFKPDFCNHVSTNVECNRY